MEVSLGDYEIYCNVILVVGTIVELNDDASFSSNMVSIRVIATFTPYLDSALEEEEEKEEEECETSQHMFLVERHCFLHEETSRSTMRQIFLTLMFLFRNSWLITFFVKFIN